MSERDKSISIYKDPTFTATFNKLQSLKNFMNKARVNFKLPVNHQVTISNEWLLGFIEGCCFGVNNVSVNFTLAQTAVNR